MSLSSTSSSSATFECAQPSVTKRCPPRHTATADAARPAKASLRESRRSPRTTTLSLRGFRPWGLLFAISLVALAEVAARCLLPDIPPEGIYGSYPLQQKIVGVERTLRERPVEVLFVGSSIVDCGIDPRQFDRLCHRSGVNITSYNLGIRGPTMAGIQPILERFFLSRLKPELVYICVSPNALNRNRTPYVSNITRRFEGMAQMSRLDEFFQRGLSRLHLYAYRSDVYAWLTSAGEKGFAERTDGPPGGFTPRHGVMDRKDDWSGRLGNFAPDPRDAEALAALCRWCVSRGTKHVIVDMPLPQHSCNLLSNTQRADYETVLHQAALPGTAVLTFSPDDFCPEHFCGGLHLNTAGADRLTTLLAYDAAKRLTAENQGRQRTP